MNNYLNIDGWFTGNDKLLYDLAVNTFNDNDIFVEIGSFKGRSSVAMAENIKDSGKNIKFFCVDNWLGSEEHQQGKSHEDADVVNGFLYDTFLKNIEFVKDYIIPIRKSSVDASMDFNDSSISFLFLDAAHDYENVKKDLNAWKIKIKSGGILSGHDWVWETVQKAVIEFCKENNLEVQPNENIWSINI